MARRISTSIIGDYRGVVGPLVFSTWMNIDVAKLRPVRGKFRKKQSLKQVEQSNLFAKISSLLTGLRSLCNKSFPKPKKANMSPLNAAVSEMMTKALIHHEGQRYIDFSLVKLSKPKDSTQQLWNPEVTTGTGRNITVSWELNPFPQKCTQVDDLVYVVYCSLQKPEFVVVNKQAERNQLSLSFNPIKMMAGHDLYLYVVIVSADGKRVAESDYLGSIVVSA